MKYQFIADHHQEFSITVMCRVLDVSRSGYYAWRKRPTCARKMADQSLTEQIETIHQDSRRTYGSRRIYETLAENGVQCGHNRVARLMREVGLAAKQSRKFKITTTVPSTIQPESTKPLPLIIKVASAWNFAFTEVHPY